jgi:hypothetical protein
MYTARTMAHTCRTQPHGEHAVHGLTCVLCAALAAAMRDSSSLLAMPASSTCPCMVWTCSHTTQEIVAAKELLLTEAQAQK